MNNNYMQTTSTDNNAYLINNAPMQTVPTDNNAYLMNKHPMHYLDANEIKDLCEKADEISKTDPKNQPTQVNGWNVLNFEKKPNSNFKAIAYEKNGEMVICYVGTDKNIKDYLANAKMVFKPSQQMIDANDYYQTIKEKHPNHRITLAGHSEGGSEAQYVCAQNGGIPTYTYNAFMAGHLFNKELRKAMKEFIVNYRDPDDLVSKGGRDIGYQYIVPPKPKNFFNRFTKIRYPHQIKNMGDCKQAISLEDYKKNNKFYIGKLDEQIFTGADIAKMDKETFALLEDYLKQNIDGNVMNTREAERLTHTGELVYVKAYVRDDGTHVEAHYRRYPTE